MPHISTKIAPKWSPDIPLSPSMVRLGLLTWHRPRYRPKLANSVSLFLLIWQLKMSTLSQRLGSLPTESMAEIFPQYRQDFPLLPPINRGGCHGLREEKIGSKVGQKTNHLPCFSSFSVVSLSPFSFSTVPSATTNVTVGLTTILSTTLLHLRWLLLPFPPQRQQPISTTIFVFFLLQHRQQQHQHQPPPPQPALPPSFPSTQLLTSGRAATVTFSLFSFHPFSLLYNFFFFLPQPTPATITSADASWATGRTTSSRLRPPC